MNLKLVIYSRANCHLCKEAERDVREVLTEINFELEIIYIDGNTELESLYGEEVPVVFINGAKYDYFRVDKLRLAKTIFSLIHGD